MEQNYKLEYAIIPKTLDDFTQLRVTSLRHNHIDEKEYHRFVNWYGNYCAASRTASKIQVTNKRGNIRDTPKRNSFFYSI